MIFRKGEGTLRRRDGRYDSVTVGLGVVWASSLLLCTDETLTQGTDDK